MRTAIVAMAVAGFGAVGCSLLYPVDDLTAGDRLRPGQTDGGAVDSGAVVDSGSLVDAAPSDAPMGEAKTIFVDDFERSTIVGNWMSPFSNAGGTIGIDSTTSTSGTRSAAVHMSTATDTRAGLASVDYPDIAHVRASFAMKTAPPDRNVHLFRIRLKLANGSVALFDLYMTTTQLTIEEQVFDAAGNASGYNAYPIPGGGFSPQVWQNWSLELDATTSPAIGTVMVDQTVFRVPLKNAFARGTLGVILGGVYAPAGPERDVWYDDVTIAVWP